MECPEVGRARAVQAPAGPQRSGGPGAAGLPDEHSRQAGGIPFTGRAVVERGERVAVAGSLDVVPVVQPVVNRDGDLDDVSFDVQPARQLGERSPGPARGRTAAG